MHINGVDFGARLILSYIPYILRILYLEFHHFLSLSIENYAYSFERWYSKGPAFGRSYPAELRSITKPQEPSDEMN